MPVWLQNLLRSQDTHTTEQAGQFAHGAKRKDLEIIRLPDKQLMLGRAGNIFSTHQPDTPVQVINLDNGNRLFRHQNFILSTAGITPQGKLSHPTGGGCQNRAFCNFLDLEEDEQGHAASLFDVADMSDSVDTWAPSHLALEKGGEPYEWLSDVSHGYIRDYAEDYHGLNFMLRPTGNLADILKFEGSGIIAADTTMKNLGTHLVAFRDGQQIVTDPSQLIKDKYIYNYLNDYDFDYMNEMSPMVDNTRLMYLITRGDPKWAKQQVNRDPGFEDEYFLAPHIAENSDPMTPEQYFQRKK